MIHGGEPAPSPRENVFGAHTEVNEGGLSGMFREAFSPGKEPSPAGGRWTVEGRTDEGAGNGGVSLSAVPCPAGQVGAGSPRGSAPIFFCLDKRKRPRPVKRKPPGRQNAPAGAFCRNTGVVRSGPAGVVSPVVPALCPGGRNTLVPHRSCGGGTGEVDDLVCFSFRCRCLGAYGKLQQRLRTWNCGPYGGGLGVLVDLVCSLFRHSVLPASIKRQVSGSGKRRWSIRFPPRLPTQSGYAGTRLFNRQGKAQGRRG